MRDDHAPTTFTFPRDNAPPLRFKGTLIAEARSSPNNARENWSGTTGRWEEYRLFRTQGGKYVCQRINRTLWQGERDTFEAAVCDTPEEITRFFGWSWLAKLLYEEAGFDVAEEVA